MLPGAKLRMRWRRSTICSATSRPDRYQIQCSICFSSQISLTWVSVLIGALMTVSRCRYIGAQDARSTSACCSMGPWERADHCVSLCDRGREIAGQGARVGAARARTACDGALTWWKMIIRPACWRRYDRTLTLCRPHSRDVRVGGRPLGAGFNPRLKIFDAVNDAAAKFGITRGPVP